MQFVSRSTRLVAFLAVVLTALPALAFQPVPSLDEFPLAWDASTPDYRFAPADEAPFGRSAALDASWHVQRDRRTGVAHFAIGGGPVAAAVTSSDQAESLARDFAQGHAVALAFDAGTPELRTVNHAAGKYAVHYRQLVHDIPVWKANAFVVLHENGRVMAMGSDFFPEVDADPSVTVSATDALANAAASLGAAIRTDLPTSTKLWFVPVPAGDRYRLEPAWEALFRADEPFGDWQALVHARSGELLLRKNTAMHVDVVGNVSANFQDFSYCDGISNGPAPNLTVNVSGGNSADTDANGDFVIPHGGATPVTITAQLNGAYFNVNRFGGLGPDAEFTGTATPGSPENIVWTTADARQDEIDCYVHAERAHEFMIDIDANFDLVALPQPMPVTVGRTDGFCPGNAWYSQITNDIHFCESGSGFANTGELGNVIYHEYGHGVSDELYTFYGSSLPSGDMHEGNSDIIANFIDRTSVVGIGFSNCSGGIRDADNNLQWPGDNNGGHFGGQIIAGFYWDAWQSLLGALPQAQADGVAWDAWHYSRVLGQPLNQPDQVLWTFIADDDNGDLDDGTPHHEHFALGATNHGFSAPPILVGIFITHEKIGHLEDGSSGVNVAAEIVGTGVTLDPAELKLFYRVNDGAYSEIVMTATGSPNEYAAQIPALSNFSEVDYYIRARDTMANEETEPADAPTAFLSFDVVELYEDGESGPGGWTVGLPGDTAFKGDWELVDPVATLAQPADDSTPGSGTMAFVTGQCGPPNCTGSCVLPQENACNDVDFGYTTLLSPIVDLAGAVQAKVKYDRWYSNNTGLSPNIDHWVVDVSNDGGSSWTNVEDTNVTEHAWVSQEIDVVALFGTPGMVQVRFIANDGGNDSVVEAGVDEFRVLADFGGAVSTPDVPAAVAFDFALRQNQPNPFGGRTRVEFSVPNSGPVQLDVFDVQGRLIRQLADGPRAAGVHHATWDGRDESGRRVAAGLYFYRLTAGERTLTRKMTILQ